MKSEEVVQVFALSWQNWQVSGSTQDYLVLIKQTLGGHSKALPAGTTRSSHRRRIGHRRSSSGVGSWGRLRMDRHCRDCRWGHRMERTRQRPGPYHTIVSTIKGSCR
jgi:hypothetical protein